jgi:hypothetical protein
VPLGDSHDGVRADRNERHLDRVPDHVYRLVFASGGFRPTTAIQAAATADLSA